MSEILRRNFKVEGILNCNFNQNGVSTIKQIEGIEVELWQKAPLDIIFLGKGKTDVNGKYAITFRLESPNPIIIEGKINGVFIKAYYKDVLITGENPY